MCVCAIGGHMNGLVIQPPLDESDEVHLWKWEQCIRRLKFSND